jgi:hypothetical protein
LEGLIIANPGDWIITGIKGEKYPCKPEILRASYEPVEPDVGSTKTRQSPSCLTLEGSEVWMQLFLWLKGVIIFLAIVRIGDPARPTILYATGSSSRR